MRLKGMFSGYLIRKGGGFLVDSLYEQGHWLLVLCEYVDLWSGVVVLFKLYSISEGGSSNCGPPPSFFYERDESFIIQLCSGSFNVESLKGQNISFLRASALFSF